MPITIPRYSAQKDLAGKSGNIVVDKPEFITFRPNTGESEGFENLGKALVHVAQARIQQEENDLVTQLHVDKALTLASFDERSDYQAFNDDVKKSQAERIEAYKANYPTAYNKLKNRIEASHKEELIRVTSRGNKLLAKDMEARWDNSMQNVFPVLLARATDENERASIMEDAKNMTENAVRSLYVDAVKAEKAYRNLGSKADFLKFRKDARDNPDEAQLKLADRDTHYPNLTPEDEFKAYDYIDRVRRQNEIALAREEKERFRQGAIEAYDRQRAWKQGKKSPDGVGFEDWLEKNRGVTISEATYQAGINKVEHARNRSALNPRMNHAQKIKYYDMKEKILLGDESITQDDIMKAGFPDGKENGLMDLIIKPKAVKSQISRTSMYIEGKMREADVDEDTKRDVRDHYSDAVQGISDPEQIRKIGEDVIKSLPQSGWGKPKASRPAEKTTEKKKPEQKGKMAPDGKGGFIFKVTR